MLFAPLVVAGTGTELCFNAVQNAYLWMVVIEFNSQ